MIRHACQLLLLLSAIAALEQTAGVPFPAGFRQTYTVVGRCQRAKSPGQRRRMPTGAGLTPTLDEHPSFAATNYQTAEYTTIHRRRGCPDGSRCSKGRCWKKVLVRCPGGFVTKRGFCQKRGEELMLTTTAHTPTTLEQISVVVVTAPDPPTTPMPMFMCPDGYIKIGFDCFQTEKSIAELPFRCHDGYLKVGSGNKCRKFRSRGHRSIMMTVPELVPRLDSFLEPTATESAEPTMLRAREMCPHDYLYVGGRCFRVLNVKEERSADSQSEGMSEKDLEAAISVNKEMKPLSATNNQQGNARVQKVKEERSADSQSEVKPEKDLEALFSDNKEMKPLPTTNNQQGNTRVQKIAEHDVEEVPRLSAWHRV